MSNAALAEVYNKNYVRTPDSGTDTNTPYGEVTITVSLPEYAPGITGEVKLQVDKFKSLVLSSASSPPCSTAGCADKTTLFRLPRGDGDGRSKTAVFQRVQLSLNAQSQYGSTFNVGLGNTCLLYTSPSPRDKRQSRMPSSA